MTQARQKRGSTNNVGVFLSADRVRAGGGFLACRADAAGGAMGYGSFRTAWKDATGNRDNSHDQQGASQVVGKGRCSRAAEIRSQAVDIAA